MSLAIYGPSLTRADHVVSAIACQRADFTDSTQITKAIEEGSPTSILSSLHVALVELKETPTTSDLYSARAFCVHELVPSSLAANADEAARKVPTLEVVRFQELGLKYFYYEPDGRWVLRNNPVDLDDLATRYLKSRWGRQAFLMMTQLGWSQGACVEGPDQFREVIKHGNEFLLAYPASEVSDEVRLEMANAYATWWNLSQDETASGSPKGRYKDGAKEAKEAAIGLYRIYLSAHQDDTRKLQSQLRELKENPKGSNTFEYFCADYED